MLISRVCWCLIPPCALPFTAAAASRSRSVTPRAASPTPAVSGPLALQSPATPSPSLSSFMSPTIAAKLSFQTLTNFIPVPSLLWSPRSCSGAFNSSSPTTPSTSSPSHARIDSAFVNAPVASLPEVPKERGYVPKERQLEKLRLRMEAERMKGGAVVGLGVEVENTCAAVLDL